MIQSATRSAKAQSTTASKTVTPLFRVQVKATKDVIYRVRNGQDKEYLVTISANGNTGCVQCESDERCPSTKTNGRKCYHIKECLKLEEARKEAEEIVASQLEDKQVTSTAQCMPTSCPQEEEEFTEDVVTRWTQEALDRAAYVAAFDPNYGSCHYLA